MSDQYGSGENSNSGSAAWSENAEGVLEPDNGQPVSVDTLNVASQQSELHWTEDPNSPLTISGSNSGSITLSNTYDEVLLIIKSGSGNQWVATRCNGDTGTNYRYVDVSGTVTTGASEINKIISPGVAAGQIVTLTGSWSERFGLSTANHWVGSGSAVAGNNTGVTSPLDSLTFVDIGGGTFDLTIEVYGR